ncbi:MAG: ABC transporter substrate-binding protein [Muribaculaceae bacterium]
MLKRLVYSIIFITLSGSCSKSYQGAQNDEKPNEIATASLLKIAHCDGYTRVDVVNPWTEGKLLQTYILVPRNAELPSPLPEGTLVRTPLERALVYSSVHAGAIKELGKVDAVKGVCDAEYYKIPEIVKGLENGSIINAGSAISPTVEKIVQLSPEAIIVSPYQNAGYGAVASLGIPIIECADYLETNPMGRAEWIKLFGELFDEAVLADSIFRDVDQKYQALRRAASKSPHKPSVLAESIIGGVWYVPGGNSYMAQMFADAGASYPWSDNTDVGSIQLDFSQVLATARDADIWLMKSSTIESYSDLQKAYELNAEFAAYKNRKVWVCNATTTNLFEEFPFHPDRLLHDFEVIFHPELAGSDATTSYYTPLKQ